MSQIGLFFLPKKSKCFDDKKYVCLNYHQYIIRPRLLLPVPRVDKKLSLTASGCPFTLPEVFAQGRLPGVNDNFVKDYHFSKLSRFLGHSKLFGVFRRKLPFGAILVWNL